MQRIKLLCLTLVLLESSGTIGTNLFATTAIAQTSQQTAPDITPSSARSVFQEAMQLYQQKTVESLRQAISKFQEAAQLFEKEGDRHQQARTFNVMGRVYTDLGEKQKALNYFEQSLALSEAMGDRAEIASNLNYIGWIYISLRQRQKAVEYFDRALLLHQSIGNRVGEVRTLRSLGQAYNELEQPQKAVQYLNRSLRLSQKIGDHAGEARTLVALGGISLSSGESQTALKSFDRSLLLSRSVSDRAGEALTLTHIGKVYHALGQHQKALKYLNQSLLLSGPVGNRAQKARTLINIAKVFRDLGQLKEALNYIQDAITIFDALYFSLDDQDLKTQYFSGLRYYYQLKIDLLMQLHRQFPTQGYDRLAFETEERTRARSLLQLLAESNITLKPKQNAPLFIQEQQLLQSMSLLEQQRSQLLDSNYSLAQAEELNQRSDRLIQQLKSLTTRLRAEDPVYTNLKYPQSLTLEQIQQQILDNNTILLEYSLGPKRSHLWVVTKTDLFSYELPARSTINATVNTYLRKLADPSFNTRLQKVLKASIPLSQMLLNPAASILKQKRLLIVSDEALQYLPFAALALPSQATGTNHTQQPNSFLLAEHEIVNIPSASTLAVLRSQQVQRKPAAKGIAIFADPVFSQNDERLLRRKASDRNQNTSSKSNTMPAFVQTLRSSAQFERLPGTRQEAEQILKLIPDDQTRFQAFDFNANKINATHSDLSQYRIVHFATHSILDGLHPELSRIVLSTINQQGTYQDSSLTLYDIFNLNLSAELVVLSACQTGLGKNFRGEGLVGLTRGFMYAGSPRVLVSLWSVNDESTAILMTDFYKTMLEQHLSPAAALKAAQVKMLQHPRWQSPYYWAAFTMQGEWQ